MVRNLILINYIVNGALKQATQNCSDGEGLKLIKYDIEKSMKIISEIFCKNFGKILTLMLEWKSNNNL